MQASRYGLAASDPLPAQPDLAGITSVTDGQSDATVADVATALDRVYCGTMSVEFDAVEVRNRPARGKFK